MSYTGFQSLDLQWGDPAATGLRLHLIDHRYLEVTCPCGHHNRAQPAQGAIAPELGAIAVQEWRLVGPGLATLIVVLKLRIRLRGRASGNFSTRGWGSSSVSAPSTRRCTKSARWSPRQKAQLIAAAEASGLLPADETSWPQLPQRLWLWVFITTTTTLYVIAGRGKATVVRLLRGFTGWLMSDGWFAYRDYHRRLRCWAHLLHKAQG